MLSDLRHHHDDDDHRHHGGHHSAGPKGLLLMIAMLRLHAVGLEVRHPASAAPKREHLF
jgi:hypothetical protein